MLKIRISNLEEKRKRGKKISMELERLFPDAKIALKFSNNWELLVAVVLSAQCTDKKVNEVTVNLFNKYKKLSDYVRASQAEFERDIKSTGFYRNKAKNILVSAKIIKEKFNGRVPDNMEDLIMLPGVARKTANIVLANAHGKVEGIAVDTHVGRLAKKLGLTKQENPDKIERELMEIFPKKEWLNINYRLIEYGREICPRRKHDCKGHPLTKIYPKAGKLWP